jgi:hypothetical protein
MNQVQVEQKSYQMPPLGTCARQSVSSASFAMCSAS